jgi:hypothetical protein
VGETRCERLGAIHLLAHGIYAFKVDAEGAKTDLVFQDPPAESNLARSVEGLVLTEWKVVTEQDARQKYMEARLQSDLYRDGVLGGIELRGYRYLVGISQRLLPNLPAEEVSDNGITYRYINIVVEPESPSIAARKNKKTTA